MTTYAFLNLGKRPDGPATQKIDRAILRKVKDALPERDWVLFLCEINEGDDNNEWHLVREMFPGATLYGDGHGPRVREPILTSRDQPAGAESVRWLNDTAVPHWSPQRSLLRVRLDDGRTLWGLHPAAGAHGQGERPAWARGLLNRSWDIVDDAFEEARITEHKKGRGQVWMADRNAYTFQAQRGERAVAHHATDWGAVWPGRTSPHFPAVKFTERPWLKMGLDSHGLLRMVGEL